MVEVWPGAEEVYARMCVAVCASWLGRDGHCMEQITQFGMGCGGADSDASVKHHLFIFDQLLSKTGQEEEKWLLSNFCCSLSLSRRTIFCFFTGCPSLSRYCCGTAEACCCFSTGRDDAAGGPRLLLL